MSTKGLGDLVRESLLAQNRGDDEQFVAALDPHVEWHAGPNPFGFPQVLHGPREVLRAAHEARKRLGRLTVTLYELEEDGNEVFVVGTLAGEKMTMPRTWIWTIRDGKVVRVRAFGSRHAGRIAWARDHGGTG